MTVFTYIPKRKKTSCFTSRPPKYNVCKFAKTNFFHISLYKLRKLDKKKIYLGEIYFK